MFHVEKSKPLANKGCYLSFDKHSVHFEEEENPVYTQHSLITVLLSIQQTATSERFQKK